MSNKVMNHVWEHSKSKANNRVILLAIADIANDSGDAYPGVGKLAVKGNMGHRSAQLCIQALERIGELHEFENVGTKTSSGWTNLYRVVMNGVKQPEVRAADGTVVQPRPTTSTRKRKFPEEVQPSALLEGMQPAAPLEVKDVQPAAPHEVQPVAPNPSGNPIQESINEDEKNSEIQPTAPKPTLTLEEARKAIWEGLKSGQPA